MIERIGMIFFRFFSEHFYFMCTKRPYDTLPWNKPEAVNLCPPAKNYSIAGDTITGLLIFYYLLIRNLVEAHAANRAGD
jgi:hypothetical protein